MTRSGSATGGSADPGADGFRDLERRRLRSLVEADMAVASALHAPDCQLVTPGGRTLSRDDYLGGVASGALDYLVFEPASDIAVLELGGGAVVRYQARIEIRVDGALDSGTFWHTDVYRLSDGQWQAVWSHATEIPSR